MPVLAKLVVNRTVRVPALAVAAAVSRVTRRPPLRKTLVPSAAALAPTTTSTKPSPLTSATATEVALGVVRVVGVAKVPATAVPRWTAEVPARTTTMSARPSRSRSATARAVTVPLPPASAVPVAAKTPGAVPR